MRMLYYYLALALPAPLLLLATAYTGLVQHAGLRHVGLGLFSAILCVATHTLLILFMIVTGRVLKAAMKARELPRAFLDELNAFFAERSAYPVALIAAAATAATAVLGYGRNIGVPLTVHMLCGLAIVVLNPWAVWLGVRTLRANQFLVDRASALLDALDAASPPPPAPPAAADFAFSARTRWIVFALSAWLPYLYWGLVVWRGEFGRLSSTFLIGTALVSAAALVAALRPASGGS